MGESAAAVTARYERLCAAPGSALRTVVRDLPLPPAMRVSSGHRLLSRPLFVEDSVLRAFARDAAALFDLLVSLPDRLFDGDLDRYCAALGLDGPRAALNRSSGGGRPPLYGRADMYHDGTAFRLLEFNIASELGGVDRAGELPRLLAAAPAFAAFAEREKLAWVHTGHEVARTLRAAGRALTGGGEPVVALLEGPGGMAAYGDDWRAFQEMVRGAGLDLRLGELGDVREHGGAVLLDGDRIDVVLRAFSADEVLDHPRGPAMAEPLLRAHREGRLVLWTPLESNLFNDKGCLALLHDPGARALLDVREADLVDRLVPWTRSLRGTSAALASALAAGGGGVASGPAAGVASAAPRDAADLIARCLAERADLVLKPHAGYGGAGVVAGWECDPADWTRAMTEAAAAGHVVQRRVLPRPEPVRDPDTGEVEPWHAAWGMFLTPDGYAGTYARLVPAGSRAVIGVEAPRARIAAVFASPG